MLHMIPGLRESSFPGWYSSVDNLVRSLDDSNVISGFQFIDHTGAMTGNGGKDTVRLFDNFTVQIEGLEPIEVDCMCADKLSSQRKDTTLLLGRDVLFKLQGTWFPTCDGNVQLSLENVPADISKESLVEKAEQVISDSSKWLGRLFT